MGLGASLTLIFLGIVSLACFWPLSIIMFLGAVLGPFMGLGGKKGDCPYCGQSILWPAGKNTGKCKKCKKRIIIHVDRFVVVE